MSERARELVALAEIDALGWRPVTADDPPHGMKVAGLNVETGNGRFGDADRSMTLRLVHGALKDQGRVVVVIDRILGRYSVCTHYMPLPDDEARARLAAALRARAVGGERGVR